MWYSEPLRLLKEEYVVSPPNYMFSYSNLGFDLLGSAIERVSREKYESYMQEHVLAPFGMDTASVTPVDGLVSRTARGYRAGVQREDIYSDSYPAGGLRGSVVDFSALLKMVFADGMAPRGRVLGTDTLAAMFDQQNAGVPMDLNFRIGLAWWLQDVGGYAVVGHSGDSRLFHSALLAAPREKLGVYVVSNSAESAPVVAEVARRMLELALGEKSGKGTGEAAAHAATVPAGAAPVVLLQESDLQAIPGYYATGLGLIAARAGPGALVPGPGQRPEAGSQARSQVHHAVPAPGIHSHPRAVTGLSRARFPAHRRQGPPCCLRRGQRRCAW